MSHSQVTRQLALECLDHRKLFCADMAGLLDGCAAEASAPQAFSPIVALESASPANSNEGGIPTGELASQSLGSAGNIEDAPEELLFERIGNGAPQFIAPQLQPGKDPAGGNLSALSTELDDAIDVIANQGGPQLGLNLYEQYRQFLQNWNEQLAGLQQRLRDYNNNSETIGDLIENGTEFRAILIQNLKKEIAEVELNIQKLERLVIYIYPG